MVLIVVNFVIFNNSDNSRNSIRDKLKTGLLNLCFTAFKCAVYYRRRGVLNVSYLYGG